MKELKNLRQRINSVDKKIIQLLNERAGVVHEVAKIKKQHKVEYYSASREEEVYSNISRINKGLLDKNSLKNIYREIMSASLALEKDITVTFLGPEASFTQMAASKKFGSSVKYLPAVSISDVFSLVEKGSADYGVVPIENSIEGGVTHTLDMFIDSDLKICAEIYLEITHYLIGNCALGSIKKIYSKPEVFGQCRLWLEANLPGLEYIPSSSTTAAAIRAAKEKHAAAIASSLAAEKYNMKILAGSIQDTAHNETRFLIVGRNYSKKSKKNKTSVLLMIKDKVGALYELLQPFKKMKINLTKIESRPSRKRAWEYYFFVDFDGYVEDEKIKKCVRDISRHCKYVKILGSYPRVF
ncbi:prephenate dehydratase [bacterium]|jgi:chorismate mutase/prephenate dehydratase|nr:prephenate dehydratase [bacterium]